MDKIDAIILAGAPAGPDIDPEGKLGSRAMVRLGDKTMLQWVVNALRGSEFIGSIAAVGAVSADGLDHVIEPGPDLMTNIKLGIETLGAEGSVLVVCSDVPLISAEAIDDFIKRGMQLDADLAYPILPRMHCESRYPGLKRTYLKTADGVFTGGNITLMRREFLFDNWDAIAGAYAARKHVLQLARMIGMGVLLRAIAAQFVPKCLKVSMLEEAVSKMLGAKVAAVVSAYPEIGEDVDKPSDLEEVRRILVRTEGRQSS